MGNEVKKCLIISGAPENEISYYNDFTSNRFVISADSGYEKCQRLGIIPNLIIGDFDSSSEPQTDIEKIVLPIQKDDTDTFFAVKQAIGRGFNDIIILGGIGSRIDHTYANILCLNYCFERNISCSLVNTHNCISIISGNNIIRRGNYKYFSLFPLFDKCEGISINNAEYPLENACVFPSEQFMQSNAFIADTAQINVKSGKLLLILSND
ncbi:MAG: thiamine diphosphokinase [Eubacterium sp.]